MIFMLTTPPSKLGKNNKK